MHPKIREKIQKKILEKAGKQDKYFAQLLQNSPAKFCRKDLIRLAHLVGIDKNTLLRFFGYGSCKRTHQLQPHNEQAIANFLGYASYDKLVETLMIEHTLEMLLFTLKNL
ncbi:MAG: hypothetical protein RMJ97_11930 [Raineya sp.]|nr:hypothetical protein [Raineya sp.]MDW8297582.1 hypothetical protein [Raineya sp.]